MRWMCLLGSAILFLVSFTGCGGGTDATTVDSSEIQEYINENPELVAHQERLSNEQEDEEDEDD